MEANQGSTQNPPKEGSELSQFSFQIAPNPNSGSFKINIHAEENISQLTLRILDQMGRTVYTKQINGPLIGDFSLQLDLSDKSSGIYYVQLATASRSESQSFILTK